MFKDGYTERLEDSLFQIYIEDDDYSDLIEYLNSEETFNSFGEGILRLVKIKYPNVEIDTLLSKIKELCKENDVPFSDIGSLNTVKGWINKGVRPKKADLTRDSLYALAFALELSAEETEILFKKVYLDRSFDCRNFKEVIYYYCIKKSMKWEKAKSLIEGVQFKSDVENEATVFTCAIKNGLSTVEDDEDLLEYISSYQHNLSLKNKAAYCFLDELLKKANEKAQQEAEKWWEDADGSSRFKGQNKESNNFTYEVITSLKVNGEKGTVTLFKNARLPKEIRNRFPEAGTLSKKNMTYEEIRKLIILLFSYIFWSNAQEKKVKDVFEEYEEALNKYLLDSGLPNLYAGNPYDWLFLYCAMEERPLDAFRNILSEVLEG